MLKHKSDGSDPFW